LILKRNQIYYNKYLVLKNKNKILILTHKIKKSSKNLNKMKLIFNLIQITMRNKRKINLNRKEIKIHTIIDLDKILIRAMTQRILI